MKTVAFYTFGCKLNFAETSSISRQFSGAGYEVVDFRDKAEVYVIHSCTVTANADRKTVAAIRQATRRNPEARVAVIGCMAELNPDKLLGIKGVDLVLGNTAKFDLAEYLKGYKPEVPGKEAAEFIPSWSVNERTRSFLKIQDGCDYYCAYCTIPLARGRSRSGNIERTMATAIEMAGQGVKEIVLTGINIGDFGRHQKESLVDLLQRMETIEGLERIRISSIEPDLLHKDIIELAALSNKLLPHFHIPLQSGSDRMLGLMNRKYKREVFAEKVMRIKELMPLCCIATDLIAGFPGEADEDFSDSFQFVKNLDLSYIHVFTYSERQGTKAIEISDKVPLQVRKKRSELLHELSVTKKEHFYDRNKGRVARVFFESANKKGWLYGFTENYVRARHPWRKELVNQIVDVKLERISEDEVFDTLLV